ncbi:isomerizing glutamine--fructose-6-phosphate transaminase, partial [Rhizobium sp. AQ_MP]|uniref:isomerizing glutamine--fructose-6-phosphate transaminase n=1 Tax=Rhizobium sp. AQ_MP TaxID=2761536 RepID=UPI001639AE54
MCGIVGIVGNKPVAERLVDALKRLEYRGYDSAGVATINDGKLDRRRAEGKLFNLEGKLAGDPLPGNIGIAHTRWATHGVPNEVNAHPHFVEGVAVVHNGIIENFAEIKDRLVAEGAVFTTQTDTEVVAQLLAKYRRQGLGRREAMHEMLRHVTGAYALAVIFNDDPSTIMAARSGPPLAIGFGDGEMFLGSDAIALSPFTNRIAYLHDGDWAVIGKQGAHIFDIDGNPVDRPIQISTASAYMIDKGNHRHFMEKEIYEQPEVISHALSHYVDFANHTVRDAASEIDFASLRGLAISACGTAYLAGLVGKYWFERYARLPVEIDVA